MTARPPFRPSRRTLLTGAAAGAVGLAMPRGVRAKATRNIIKARPLPAKLTPGAIYSDAVESNRKYLLSLEPERLLHNFRKFAGMTPRGEIYGGWESDTISGHTLGHYLSALSLMYAQTGDVECRARAERIVEALSDCQRLHNDGYVAGLMRRRGDVVEDGKIIFAEIADGDIRAQPFDLNGAWSPLYNMHKTFAGALDAHKHAGIAGGLNVAHGLGIFLHNVFAKLDDAQVQTVLDCEHGGIVESLAELHARTSERKFLALAERLYHKKVLDPLGDGRDELEGLHANTQIPKLMGLARLYEITGKPHYKKAVETFWHAVVEHHTYVIGGNSDREHFQKPDTISKYITEQTCESCNTYNMLKLTRHLYAWEPRAAYFDYYERAHLNHIMAQHNAETGMFAYMVPLMAGTHREWSKPTDDFWCCVGTGMESHSKHGDSVFWTDGEMLFVNQFVSASLNWVDRRTTFELKAGYHSEWPRKSLHVITAVHPTEFAVAIRVPAWCTELNGVLVDPCVTVNGASVQAERRDDYAVIRRVWRSGDVVGIELFVSPRFEPTHDDNSIGAILFGPTVLAASLGQSDTPFAGSAPALVTDDEEAFLGLASDEFSVFQSSLMKPQSFVLAPFRWMSDRNTAVYFRRFTNAEWATEQKRVADEAARIAALNARSIDIVKLGDETDEKAHDLTSKISYALSYRFRKGRDARDGGYFEFQMKAKRGPLALRATYWGDERDKLFHISVDRMRIATVQQDGTGPIAFIDRDYPIPPELTHGKRKITVRFEPAPKSRVTPVYGVRLLPA